MDARLVSDEFSKLEQVSHSRVVADVPASECEVRTRDQTVGDLQTLNDPH